jgi:hypothetical protein
MNNDLRPGHREAHNASCRERYYRLKQNENKHCSKPKAASKQELSEHSDAENDLSEVSWGLRRSPSLAGIGDLLELEEMTPIDPATTQLLLNELAGRAQLFMALRSGMNEKDYRVWATQQNLKAVEEGQVDKRVHALLKLEHELKPLEVMAMRTMNRAFDYDYKLQHVATREITRLTMAISRFGRQTRQSRRLLQSGEYKTWMEKGKLLTQINLGRRTFVEKSISDSE